MPFAHTVVVSEALPKSFTRPYCIKNVKQFKGVDEVAWIEGLQAFKNLWSEATVDSCQANRGKSGLCSGKTRFSRCYRKTAVCIRERALYTRYNEEGKTFGVKAGFEDSANLVANSDLVVSYGGTIAREAALLGVPSIAISDMAKTYVNQYVAKKGFPLFITTEQGVLGYAKKFLGKRFDVQSKLAELENPVDVIEKVVESLRR